MKNIYRLISSFLLNIPSMRRKSQSYFGRFENGGLQPPASPTYEVKFKSY